MSSLPSNNNNNNNDIEEHVSLSPSEIDILQSPKEVSKKYSYRPANKWFNKIVGPRSKEYFKTSSSKKKQLIVEEILEQVKEDGRRFWKLDDSSKWVELTKDEAHKFVTSRFRGLKKRSRSGLDQFLEQSSKKGKFVGSIATFEIPPGWNTADSVTCTQSTFSWSYRPEEKKLATRSIPRRKKLDPPGQHAKEMLEKARSAGIEERTESVNDRLDSNLANIAHRRGNEPRSKS